MDGAVDIETQVIEMLSNHVEKGTELTGSTRIMADTNMDSVAVMDFVLDLEDAFDITIPLNRLAEITTVDELVAAVKTLSNQT